MPTTVLPLVEVLREIPEVRERQGRRHPLEAILAPACAAMLCGYRSYSAIAEWGRTYDAELVRALGFTHQPTPCAATFFHVGCSAARSYAARPTEALALLGIEATIK